MFILLTLFVILRTFAWAAMIVLLAVIANRIGFMYGIGYKISFILLVLMITGYNIPYYITLMPCIIQFIISDFKG